MLGRGGGQRTEGRLGRGELATANVEPNEIARGRCVHGLAVTAWSQNERGALELTCLHRRNQRV